ncbi:MAG: hypothetical protein ACOC8B_06240, partial [Gemmatimonadota bacterium]
VEVTLRGIGTSTPSATAAPYSPPGDGATHGSAPDPAGGESTTLAFDPVADADDSGDGTIQLEPISTGSFTDGERGAGGERYLRATFRVRNAQDDGTAYDTPRENLTFLAVDTDGTLGETAVSSLVRFDDTDADPGIAVDVLPTGAARRTTEGTVEPEAPDVFQAITETEAAAVLADAPTGVNTVFPYGFVVRNPDDPSTRTLPANPAADQFDGVVTFAFRLPLQATSDADPFEVSVVVLAVDDDETRLTESLEERTALGADALQDRADAFGPTAGVTLLGGSPTVVEGHTVRRICTLRTAGTDPGAPTATLVDDGSGMDGEALPSNIRTVDIEATGAADGTTWTDAFPTLQDALACVRDQAGAGEPCEGVDELWVAEGVYYPDEGAGVTDDDEFATFSLVPGVSLYGGFVGGEANREQRDHASNVTILSGDIGQDDANADGDFIAESTEDHVGTNSSTIVTADGTAEPITTGTVLDGFVITAGAAQILEVGAGIHCDGSGSAGVCSPTLRNLAFSGNRGISGGGALYLDATVGGESSPRVENATFTGNTHPSGGGLGGAVLTIAADGGTAAPVFVRVAFTDNGFGAHDLDHGGAVAIYIPSGAATAAPTFYQAEFRGNRAGSDGGAIMARSDTEVTLVNSVFWDNQAGSEGGAIFFDTGTAGTLTNVTFSGNTAAATNDPGGAIDIAGTDLDLANVIAWGDSPEEIAGTAGTATASHSIIEGGCPTGFTCTDVLDQHPGFADEAGGDLRLGVSPAVDAGSNSILPADPYDLDGDGDTAELLPLDLDDLPRVVDWGGDDGTAVVDIGAYEKQG